MDSRLREKRVEVDSFLIACLEDEIEKFDRFEEPRIMVSCRCIWLYEAHTGVWETNMQAADQVSPLCKFVNVYTENVYSHARDNLFI